MFEMVGDNETTWCEESICSREDSGCTDNNNSNNEVQQKSNANKNLMAEVKMRGSLKRIYKTIY